MNISTMHIGVKQELDKTSALELPSFEPEEIDFWLNNAIRKFVKTRYSGVNIKGESFEQTQKRTEDLRTLIISLDLPTVAEGIYPNSEAFSLPVSASNAYWFALQEDATISVGGVTSRTGVTECTLDEYSHKINDPFSEHILHYATAKPLRVVSGASVNLITDGAYTVSTYHLVYLKKPAEVSITVPAVNCDLPEHTHDEVVKMAANMMLENIEQPRYKTHMAEVATME